jgi:hypothetical protein
MKVKIHTCIVYPEIKTTRSGIRKHLKDNHVARARGIVPNIKKMYLNKEVNN